MTTETAVHPRITEAAANLTKRLLALEQEPGEYLVRSEVVVRNGIPRKWKTWAEPGWQEPDRCI